MEMFCLRSSLFPATFTILKNSCTMLATFTILTVSHLSKTVQVINSPLYDCYCCCYFNFIRFTLIGFIYKFAFCKMGIIIMAFVEKFGISIEMFKYFVIPQNHVAHICYYSIFCLLPSSMGIILANN